MVPAILGGHVEVLEFDDLRGAHRAGDTGGGRAKLGEARSIFDIDASVDEEPTLHGRPRCR